MDENSFHIRVWIIAGICFCVLVLSITTYSMYCANLVAKADSCEKAGMIIDSASALLACKGANNAQR